MFFPTKLKEKLTISYIQNWMLKGTFPFVGIRLLPLYQVRIFNCKQVARRLV